MYVYSAPLWAENAVATCATTQMKAPSTYSVTSLMQVPEENAEDVTSMIMRTSQTKDTEVDLQLPHPIGN